MSTEYVALKKSVVYSLGITNALVLDLVSQAPTNLLDLSTKNQLKGVKLSPSVLKKYFGLKRDKAVSTIRFLEAKGILIPHSAEGRRFTYYTINEVEFKRATNINYKEFENEDQDSSNPEKIKEFYSDCSTDLW